jgi:hypothetical protein
MARRSRLSTLTGLCLGGNAIGADAALARSPHLAALKHLELDAL